MGTKYLAIRGVPVPKNGKLETYTEYTKILKEFFKHHKICDACKGDGYTIDDNILILDKSDNININYRDIEELQRLKDRGINLGDKIRQILESVLWERKPCKKCNGSGFVKK